MKLIPIILLLIAQPLLALNKEEILKIAAKPHSRENLLSGLKIYPNAREYGAKEWMVTPDGEKFDGPAFTVKEKVVEGRYMVSEMHIPVFEKPLYMVVTFDTNTETYKKSVLLPEGEIASSTGIRDMKTKTIA